MKSNVCNSNNNNNVYNILYLSCMINTASNSKEFSFSGCCIHCIMNGFCYKLKTLELVKRKNLILGLTQENLIENSVQDSLPYILNPYGPC